VPKAFVLSPVSLETTDVRSQQIRHFALALDKYLFQRLQEILQRFGVATSEVIAATSVPSTWAIRWASLSRIGRSPDSMRAMVCWWNRTRSVS
jgi:hypothetical protein